MLIYHAAFKKVSIVCNALFLSGILNSYKNKHNSWILHNNSNNNWKCMWTEKTFNDFLGFLLENKLWYDKTYTSQKRSVESLHYTINQFIYFTHNVILNYACYILYYNLKVYFNILLYFFRFCFERNNILSFASIHFEGRFTRIGQPGTLHNEGSGRVSRDCHKGHANLALWHHKCFKFIIKLLSFLE